MVFGHVHLVQRDRLKFFLEDSCEEVEARFEVAEVQDEVQHKVEDVRVKAVVKLGHVKGELACLVDLEEDFKLVVVG